MAKPMVIEFVAVDDEGMDVEHELPAKFGVCPNCQGHGTHLRAGMRDHAYTAEEFYESFDEEEAEEYFKHGGRYDVTCEECHGARVVTVVDEEECRSPEQKIALAAYHAMLEEKWQYDQDCAAERRMGC